MHCLHIDDRSLDLTIVNNTDGISGRTDCTLKLLDNNFENISATKIKNTMPGNLGMIHLDLNPGAWFCKIPSKMSWTQV